MKLYGLKACDTCRAAMKALQGTGRDVEFVDVRQTPLSPEQLALFLEAFGEALVNRRSTTWRGLSEEERAASPVALLAAHPTLMKRPVIEAKGRLFLGWNDDTRVALTS